MKTKEYKGFEGEYQFEPEYNIYQGKIINITDLIMFESCCDGKSIQEDFEKAVDDYLELLGTIGINK